MTKTERAIIKAAEYWRSWFETRVAEAILESEGRSLAEAVDADRKARRGKA